MRSNINTGHQCYGGLGTFVILSQIWTLRAYLDHKGNTPGGKMNKVDKLGIKYRWTYKSKASNDKYGT